MSNAKPILFNTDMVRAILDGRKSVTRRVIKPQPIGSAALRPPVLAGDILWVRETWRRGAGRYMYRADYINGEEFFANGKKVDIKWSPSIHMPKEAARIYLRVVYVHLEQLKHISCDEMEREGVSPSLPEAMKANEFGALWNSTIKPSDRDRYGWEANPFVWKIDFQRCEKPEV